MKKIDFNKGWLYGKCNEHFVAKKMLSVNLPHDAMIYEERCKESAAGGANGYFPGGKYVYEKEFLVDESWKDMTAIVEFEAVYRNSVVYVNGEKAVEWPYGYTNFSVNLDAYLKYGEKNIIKVLVDNSECPNSRWYSGSGIYREVNLYLANKTCIKKDGVRISTENQSINGNIKSIVNVAIQTENCDKGAVEISIFDCGVLKVCEKANIADNKGVCTLVVENMQLWDAENPNLYTCVVKLLDKKVVLDEDSIAFGIRTLDWSTKGFFVNGISTLFRGGCVHHDNGILGSCNFNDAEERKIRIMKESGFNAIRSSHNPMSKAMLDACDRLGMYVIDESFDQWLVHKNMYDYGSTTFEKWWKKDTEAMIIKGYNHPSVIMYSIGNEIAEIGTKKGQDLCGEMVEYIKSIDNTRVVTAGVNILLAFIASKGKMLYNSEGDGKLNGVKLDNLPTSAFFNLLMNKLGGWMELTSIVIGANKSIYNACEKLDITGYNYASPRYKRDIKVNPNRVIVGSETLPKALYKNWQMVKKLPHLLGDFMWTSWDYLGEAGIGTVQYKSEKQKGNLIISSGSGIIDICGKKRPEVEWGKIIWGLRDKPYIGVDPLIYADDKKVESMWRDTDAVASWSWEGCEGKKTKVIVFSDAPFVELFVNNVSQGIKKTKANKAVFKKVAYQKGIIKSVSLDIEMNPIADFELKSATGKDMLKVALEKNVLTANGQDLCFIDIDVIGENGITKSSTDKKITIKVEGGGTLQAFGSARPYLAEDFNSTTHTTFYGKALAIVRAGYEIADIKVTVSADGVEDKVVNIKVN